MGESISTGTGTSDSGGKHKLRIIFDGVIALGPPPPEKGDTQEGPYFGVMARSTRRLSHRSQRLPKEPRRYIPMHVPSVYTTMTPHDDGRQPDQVYQLLEGDPKWQIWHPLRERLEFRFDDRGDIGTLTYVDQNSLETVKEGQVKLHGIRRVPDARAISPDHTHLLPDLLSPDAGVSEAAVAQILVPWGEVRGGGIFDKAEGIDVVFEPGGDPRNPQTVVPNVVITVEAEYVEIATYSLDTGDALDPLKFHLTGEAEIWVSNGDPSDTAVDLKTLSELRGVPRSAPDSATVQLDRFVDEFEQFGFQFERSPIRSFLERVYTSGGGVVPPIALTEQPNRSSEVDIDFELFYTITGPRPGTSARSATPTFPVPVKADRQPFLGPNCYVKQVQTTDSLILKSNPPQRP